MTGIYKITSPTGKVYIGSSIKISKRKNSYKNIRCKEQPKIYSSLKKYGWEKHVFEVIHQLPDDVHGDILDTYEILYWELYKDCGVEMLNCKSPGKRGIPSKEGTEKMKETKAKNFRRKLELEGRLIPKPETKRTRVITEKQRENLRKLMTGITLIERFGEKRASEISHNRSIGLMGKTSKPIVCVNTGQVFDSIRSASKILGVHENSIGNILAGRTKTTRKGLTFNFINKQKL